MHAAFDIKKQNSPPTEPPACTSVIHRSAPLALTNRSAPLALTNRSAPLALTNLLRRTRHSTPMTRVRKVLRELLNPVAVGHLQ